MRYRVTCAALDVNGKLYREGELLDESLFSPAPEVTEEQKRDGIVAHLSEIESLLLTKHISPE